MPDVNNVNPEELKTSNEKPEEIKPDESKLKRSKRYELLINVKYGDTPHKAGEKILIKEEDIPEFEKAGAIKSE